MRARLLALCALSIAATLAQAQATIGIVSGFARGRVAVVNPATHRAYLADEARGGIAVVEGTSVVATIPLARVPTALAVNSAFNRIYAVNGEDGVLSIIDGNTNTVRNLPIGAGPPLLVNELRNRVYAGAQSARMLSMDGEGNGVSTVDVGGGACGVALNAQTDQLYVANCTGRASVVDLLTGNVTSFPVPGFADAVAVNPLTNRAYVVSRETPDFVTVIDGASRTARTPRIAGASGTSMRAVRVVVNPSANRVYITRGYEILVLDAGSETFSLVTYSFEETRALAVDPAIQRTVISDGYRRLLTIDGANRMDVYDLSTDAFALAMDESAHRYYAVGEGATYLDAGFFPIRRNYQGMWWNPSESGWGLDIAQQGNTFFAAWFTYDEFGHPAWFVMPSGKPNSSDGSSFNGTLYRVAGSPYASPFDSSRTDAKVVGVLSVQFNDADNGTMEATVNSARVTKAITRQVFAPPAPACGYSNIFATAPNFTDIWWQNSESGWGVFLTHQGDNVFLAWFTYDLDGSPMWLVGSNIVKTGNLTYSGTLYRTTGPPFTESPWRSANVSATAVGTATLVFQEVGATTFTYTVGGVSGRKFIGRQQFSSPVTRCG
jgi:DNA-binding beta-propeller fold protein YncE